MENLLNAENITSQNALYAVEALCTQDQPPACAAACPLHLDVRELARLVAAGDAAGAFKIYAKAVPFARLVAATCAAPCQGVCKRAQLGGAVQINQLERWMSSTAGKAAKPPLMLPKKPQKAAIAGGGLRGLAAANDLARKGYAVTLYEKAARLGGALCALPGAVLPAEVLAEEVESLLALGNVTVVYDTEVPLASPEAAASFLLAEHDAAFVACASPLGALADGASLVVAGQPALLAGRLAARMAPFEATTYDVADGRAAATTMVRLFQGVSVEAGREREGSFETTLFTSLEGIAPAPPVPCPEDGYTADGAQSEAGRCIQCECLECVKKCGFMQHYKGYPKTYAREVYNNLSIAMGTRHANKMINTCALCSQCEAVCPNGLDMRQVFLAARQKMVDTQKMPPSAHEFALLDMDYSLSDAFYTLRHQPGREASAWLFFPGCQLAASEPELVQAAYADLAARLEGGVGLWLACCGVMAHWSGNRPKLEAVKQKLLADWEAMGRPTVVAACPSCAATLGGQFGITVVSLFEVLEENGLPGGAPTDVPGKLALHHACGARYDTATQNRVRGLAATAGVRLAEAAPENQSPCCGYGGLAPFANSEVAAKMTQTALAQMTDATDGAGPLLTYCVNCRDRYLAQGAEAWHLLELVYPAVPARRSPPTWSARQQNRKALKHTLLKAYWKEITPEEKTVELLIAPELEAKLEETHILHSDIAAAIEKAEADGCKLADAGTGRFTASHRPANVTFWVEYAPEGAGYRVFNAWCHRMDAIVTDKLSESGAGSQ